MGDYRESERLVMLQAFIDSRNEKDRSIFLSAVAGVGFSTTMLFNNELTGNQLLTIFMGISLVLFTVAAAAILIVFNANAALMQRLLHNPAGDTRSKLIEAFDWIAVSSFVFGTLAIGASIIVHLACKSP